MKKKIRKFERIPFFGSVLGGFSRAAQTDKGDTPNDDGQMIECLATYFSFPAHKEELNLFEEDFSFDNDEDSILLEVVNLTAKDKDKLVEIFLPVVIFISSDVVIVFCNHCIIINYDFLDKFFK